MNIRTLLSKHIADAMVKAGIPTRFPPHVMPSKNPQFGDYQANGAMAAAKHLGAKPRDLAQKISDTLTLDGIAAKTEIAGPGFINIHLDHNWLAAQLTAACKDERFGIAPKAEPETVVIDMSSPNLAKEMHIGHLRSTIIGDAMARVLEFMGDTVVRQNHVGDWGTQFGMLIAELEAQLTGGEQAELALKDLESFYQQAKKHFDDDPAFATTAREYVVKLQSGDAKVGALWEKYRSISLAHNQEIYELLNVGLGPADVCGESFYNADLPVLVEELKACGLAQEDQGALVVFLQEFADKEGKPAAMIIQKNDGGYLYATTDLAAVRYRSGSLKGNRLMYFIDDRQSLHMKQVFAVARKAGFVDEEVTLEHHAFGKILGKDKKPFKTRTGGTVKLAEFLHEAAAKAAQVVKEKSPDLDPGAASQIARKVGIGAVKYADLAKTRTNDYVFDWDLMLSFEGNTGPYMQYAYARVMSLFRKAQTDMAKQHGAIAIGTPQERALALKLLQLEEVIEQVAEEAYPHTLCSYLYDIASLYMSFYEACPILKDGVSPEQKASRLELCKACARALKLGLNLLGIEVMERM